MEDVLRIVGQMVQAFLEFCSNNRHALINLLTVFFLAAFYSAIELLARISLRWLFRTFWGRMYLLINGLIGMLALGLTFPTELNKQFLGSKILLAGTSALALLRVIAVPIKYKGEGTNAISMIEIILKHLTQAYDRERSNIDLGKIKEIMKDVDFDLAAETLGILIVTLLQTMDDSEQKKLKKDIESLRKSEEAKSIKHIILGHKLAGYVGIDMLSKTVSEMKQFIVRGQPVDGTAIDNDSKEDDLQSLIEKYNS